MKLGLSLIGAIVLSVFFASPIQADDSPKSTTPGAISRAIGRPKSAMAGSSKSPGEGSPKTPTPDSPNAEVDETTPQVRVFTLRYVRATQATEMLKQLGYQGNFVPDPRTDSLIAKEIPGELSELETLLKAIDRPNEEPVHYARDKDNGPRFGRTPRNRPAAVGPADELATATRPPIGESASENVRALRKAFLEHDVQASQTAAELRRLQRQAVRPGLRGQQDEGVADLQRKLRAHVAVAYEFRTKMQQAEVNWLRERLSRIERQIQDGGQLKEQIIERRVEELLNPGLQWEPSNLGAAADGAAGIKQQQPGVFSPKEDVFPSEAAVVSSQVDVVSSLYGEQKTKQNLRQLSLAMHNYHDVYHHFPKAATTAREAGGKTDTPHSWRIDLLPFVGGTDLYQQYQMDEPWDGPNNKKLIGQMPDVFRSPYDDPKSTNSSYYVLVGGGTVFEPGSQAVKASDITDGTSNTILIVEMKRSIPWTKPEDIPFDAARPTPKLRGFIEGKVAAAMADGSVHLFNRAKIEDILTWMIVRNDQHVIMIPFNE
jgi:hypothetical protein